MTVFLIVSTVLFVASATTTVAWCTWMSGMGEMVMPGGWTMSMAWMRMPGQTWPGTAASFVGMWTVMMAAMMLPSFAPTLWRCYKALNFAGANRAGWLTIVVGAAYAVVWTAFGVAAFPLGAALAAIQMRLPSFASVVPIAAGMLVTLAGALQFTAWKAHHLACWRDADLQAHTVRADAGAAWRHGIRLGLRCSQGCANLMAILLAMGIMDVAVMTVVTAAITLERVAPAGERMARAIGTVIVGAGLFMLAKSAGLA
jgi:predicted metal-binding membrane protein